MSGFNDFRCKCGARIGWYGEITEAPPCPACGKQLDQKELEDTKAKIDRLRAEMLKGENDGPVT
jgi:hypothetical protein